MKYMIESITVDREVSEVVYEYIWKCCHILHIHRQYRQLSHIATFTVLPFSYSQVTPESILIL